MYISSHIIVQNIQYIYGYDKYIVGKNILHISISCNLITYFKESFPNAPGFCEFVKKICEFL